MGREAKGACAGSGCAVRAASTRGNVKASNGTLMTMDVAESQCDRGCEVRMLVLRGSGLSTVDRLHDPHGDGRLCPSETDTP